MVEVCAELARHFADDHVSFRARGTYSYLVSLGNPVVSAALLTSLLQLEDPLLGPQAVEELVTKGYISRLDNGDYQLLI